MSMINSYHKKLEELEALKTELERMEHSDQLKQELEFKAELEKLMDQYSKDANEVLKVLGLDVEKGAKGSRRTRAVMVFTNPHTGEVVKTKGGNHATLREWREEYGKEAVDSWKETA